MLPSVPLRSIVSTKGSPTYNTATFLAKLLEQKRSLGPSHIKNSTEFVNKLLPFSKEALLVSFYVKSLFKNIPVQDTIDIINRTLDLPKQFLQLTEFCLSTTYFLFNGDFYEQTSGTAMGSPLSPVIAVIFMTDFERKLL